jgi:hypothetical protein
MTNVDDLTAWLGPAADQLTAEQREAFDAAAADIAQRYPHPDEQAERDAALSATVQYLLGETSAHDAARTLVAARAEERRAFVHAEQVGVLLVRLERSQKAPAAEAVGISRGALLKALGER